MRVLGVGEHNDLGDLYFRLLQSGHEVRVRVADENSKDVLAGLVPQSQASWDEDLAWVGRGPGLEGGLLLFEGAGQGELQSQLRDSGYKVIGGSKFGDRLESDRQFGQSVLRELGLPTAAMHEFDGFDDALAFVRTTRRRYVLKFSGSGFASTRSYVGALEDGSDMEAVLLHQRRCWTYDEAPRLILMQHLSGVEVGVGAFFNGQTFVRPANIDWEHKRFFPGDLGELTGEMGTVVSYEHAEKLFAATLERMTQQLCAEEHVGYVNLNMIVNAQGAWPLEFTCRFGYPGFPILSALHKEPWDEVLLRVIDPKSTHLPTYPGFSVGVVLTVPPFPYPDGYERLSKGVPVCFVKDLSVEERQRLHYGEVGLQQGQLVTAGVIGYAMVVTGRGETIAAARTQAYALAQKVVIPNVRYRLDIGVRLMQHDYAELQRLGWLPVQG